VSRAPRLPGPIHRASRTAGTVRRWGLALALVLAVCFAGPLRAETTSSAFDGANRLYEQGKFSQAAAGYQKLLESGRASAALFFNLGNAYFKAGQIGRAIVAYDQAKELSPRDPDLRANLQFARNRVQGPTVSPTRWQRALGTLSLNEWTVLAAGVFWLWLLLLAWVQWRPAYRAALRRYVVGLGVVVAVVVVCLAGGFYETRLARRAIVIAPEASVRQGPLEEAQSAFTVHDGAELAVLDQKDQWLQVSTDPRRIGWVRGDEVCVLPH
jgi:tetratricopeptide (TPR) repeat protein